MKPRNETERLSNPYNDDKVIAACSIFGMMDISGKAVPGGDVIRAIANMHDRSNGLGGGFAVYGIYPEYADCYAFHIMYPNNETRSDVERYLIASFTIVGSEEIPTQPASHIHDPPLVRRYFLLVDSDQRGEQSEEEYVFDRVMTLNTGFPGALVFSSGRNMGVFKGVGYPEEIAHFFRLEDYQGYLWTAHGRFPTNTRGWWGGAHPFSILDWSVVHNGEISSYGTNRRYLEMFGYQCTMHTDTEVVAYAVDLLVRRHGLPIELAAKVFAPPLWKQIEYASHDERSILTALRQTYSSLLLNGPFSVIIARQGEMIGLTDRVRLRPLTAATKGDLLFLSSEESAIRLVCPDVETAWTPMGGEPIIGRLREPLPLPKEELEVAIA
jgi:glutamate synthase domain-containing protein 1